MKAAEGKAAAESIMASLNPDQKPRYAKSFTHRSLSLEKAVESGYLPGTNRQLLTNSAIPLRLLDLFPPMRIMFLRYGG
jgi:hypothetical protein